MTTVSVKPRLLDRMRKKEVDPGAIGARSSLDNSDLNPLIEPSNIIS
jgi:hypothetical protein